MIQNLSQTLALESRMLLGKVKHPTPTSNGLYEILAVWEACHEPLEHVHPFTHQEEDQFTS